MKKEILTSFVTIFITGCGAAAFESRDVPKETPYGGADANPEPEPEPEPIPQPTPPPVVVPVIPPTPVVMEPAPEPVIPPVVSKPEPPAVVIPEPMPPACMLGEIEVSQVKLLTTSVNFLKTNQKIKYELTLVNCKDGTLIPFNNKPILFDLNMIYQTPNTPVSYTIVDAASMTSIVSGPLKTISGSDLFGTTHPNYRHWLTENVTFKTAVEKIILEIDLSESTFRTLTSRARSADSYLKFGNAKPVTQPIEVLYD